MYYLTIRDIINDVVDIIYPPRCPICNRVTVTNTACDDCRYKLKYVGQNRCLKCGKELNSQDAEYCEDCKRIKHAYDYGVAVFSYDESIKASIYRFKYKNYKVYAEFYAAEICRIYENIIRNWEIEIIIPVPMYRRKQQIRGFNQSEIIAERLSYLLNIPMDSNFLSRKKNTTPQKDLTDQDRVINIKNAFQIEQNSVKYNKVLLVDDIYTTGTTIDECAKLLKQNGAKSVYFVTVCIGRGF